METDNVSEPTSESVGNESVENSKTEPLDLRERIIWVINESVIDGRGRYTYLEHRTGISAKKWKNVCNRLQQPSVEMIAALARELRGNWLEWMVCGSVQNLYQVNPFDAESVTKWEALAERDLASIAEYLRDKRKRET